jgi:NitT/TauT family transport system permease protein
MAIAPESASYSAPKRWPDGRLSRRVSRDAVLAVVLPVLTGLVLLLLWDWSIERFDIPATLLPRSADALGALWYGVTSGVMIVHTLVTLQEVFYGFVIGAAAGFVFGVVVAEWALVRMALYPFLIAIQMTPKVAIAPLFIIWLGYGIASKVAIAACITFFPVLINTVAGLRAVDVETLEMMRAFRATRWQAFRRVKLTFALPYIFAGLEVAVVLAVIGAIVAEFIGATKGLGYLMLQATYKLDTAQVFAVLVMLALLGMVLNMLIRVAARRALFWHDSERSIQG